MIDSNIRGLYKRIEYQIANLKGLFSKNEKQMIDNVNEIKRDNEDFKDSQKYIFDTHKADVNNPHKVTKSQIGLGDVDNVKQASAEEFNNHVNSQNNPHAVTKTQVGLGNVDNIRQASKAEFDNHIGDKNLHTTETEKNKWNDAQLFRITSFEGSGKFHVGNTDDLHEKVTLYNGFVYFTSSSNAINGPGAALRGLWISASDAKYGTIMGYDNANRTWLKTYVDGVWSKWERLLTNSEKVEWKSPIMPLLNGWKQYSTLKVQFYKNSFGEVELIGAITGGTIGMDVPVFTLPDGYRPIQSEHFIGVASSLGTGSVPQYHRTQIDTKGNVYIQSVSNTVNPNEFISFGFKFMAAPKEE
ncbi:hypothetical protein [Bacillus safensis]|uniref:hypothetical protein n=1 Tax=Bacillus safensis TaxID=561879 RepID=UPI0021E58974|nr:hypothetical protein [Bacillus safensis]UXO88750.1 hypothetical protein N7921_03345 [Bacillus safensis]